MNYLLNFKNKTLEQDFISNHHLSLAKSERLINIVLICYCLSYTTRYIFDYFFSPDYTLTTMFTAMAIIFGSCALYYLGKYIFRRIKLRTTTADITVLFVSILALVLLNNPIRTPKDTCEESYVCFWDCFEIAIFNLIMVQFLRRWYHKAFYYTFNCVYFLVWKQGTIYDTLMVIKIIGFIIMITCLYYFTEKGVRIKFLEKYYQDVSTKHILKALPEGILIIDDNLKCHHSNSSLIDLFQGLEPDDPNSIEAFTKNIQYPKPRNFFANPKSPFYAKIFLNQGQELLRSNRGTNANSILSEDGFSQTGNTQQVEPENIPTVRSLLKSSGSKKERVTFSPSIKRRRMDSQDISNSPTADNQSQTSLYGYLQDFIKAFKEVESYDEEALEHYYFDAKYEGKTLEISLSPLNFLNKKCFLLIFRDKTYSDLITELENSSKYKSDVLASVAHELRTPVNSCLFLINSVLEFDQVPETCLEEYVKPTKSVLTMMLSLINDILDYSQVKKEKLKLVFQPIDIKQVITEALGIIDHQARKKGLTLLLDLEALIPPLFETDPNRLTQILLNLLSNAYKFTIKGSITVSANFYQNDVTLLEISVKDTGIGIKEEDLEKLFMGFEKIDLGENQGLNPNGCGLGLIIANKLAKNLSREELGGIKVESEVGVGSKFSFVIENKRRRTKSNLHIPTKTLSLSKFSNRPFSFGRRLRSSEDFSNMNMNIVEIADDEEPIWNKVGKKIFLRTTNDVSNMMSHETLMECLQFEQQVLERIKTEKCECPAVLIVDDDSFNQLALENMLKKLNYTCKSVFNGKDALEEVKKREDERICGASCAQFRAIFMDCNMPIKDGFEATKDIKNFLRENDLARIPIIGLSAHLLEAVRNKVTDAGMDYFLTKPTTKEKVRGILWEIEDSVE